MQLYLVQHGVAKSEAEDPQWSLTAEGTKTVERMAKHLSSLRLHVGRIEHSGKERARQTAEIMAAHLRPEVGARQVAGISPNDVGPMRERGAMVRFRTDFHRALGFYNVMPWDPGFGRVYHCGRRWSRRTALGILGPFQR